VKRSFALFRLALFHSFAKYAKGWGTHFRTGTEKKQTLPLRCTQSQDDNYKVLPVGSTFQLVSGQLHAVEAAQQRDCYDFRLE
jgi:hypothetical protein